MARHFAMPDDADPVALLQRAHDRRADRHAADLLDLAAGDRLAVSDQRQRLQQRARIARRTLLPQARHHVGATRTNLHAPAARDLDQLDAARLVLGGEHVERGAQLLGGRPLALVEQLQQLVGRDRPAGRQQRRFDEVLEVVLVHFDASGSGLSVGSTVLVMLSSIVDRPGCILFAGSSSSGCAGWASAASFSASASPASSP